MRLNGTSSVAAWVIVRHRSLQHQMNGCDGIRPSFRTIPITLLFVTRRASPVRCVKLQNIVCYATLTKTRCLSSALLGTVDHGGILWFRDGGAQP